MPLHLQFDSSRLRQFPSNGTIGKRMHHSGPSTPTEKQLYYRFSPFEILPIELQVEIFSYFIPPFPSFDIEEGPLLISRVCRAWRTVVLNTPKLWSAFEIVITGSSTSDWHRDSRVMKTMKLWLDRSKQYPLSVRMQAIGRVPDLRVSQFLALLELESHRWRSVEFVLPSVNLSELSSKNVLRTDFPVLQSLTLKMKGSLDTSLLIPWRQLTTLDIRLDQDNMISLDGWLGILSQTERLKRCTINADCTIDPDKVRETHLALPSLEDLDLILQGGSGDTQIACLVHFLDIFSLPTLRSLSLGWHVQQTGTQTWSLRHAQFLAFLRRTAQTMQTLKLSYFPLSTRELLECLSQVPKLTHLDLKYSLSDHENDPITDGLLAACTFASSPQITTNYATTTLLPLLEFLNIECHGKRYTPPTLLSFIQSRRKFQARGDSTRRSVLKSFHLFSMNYVLQEIDRNVNKWSQEGMDISITSLVIR